MMSEEIRAHYYMNIPAFVWDDKELLKKPKAILLYGHIATLANKKGYCWATNEYFAKRLKVDKRTVIDYVNILVEKGYIKRKVFHKPNSKEVEKRIISIFTTPSDVDFTRSCDADFTTPSDADFTENNTSINNTRVNNKNNILSSSHSTVSHADDYKTIIDYLNQKAGTNYWSTTQKTQRLINARFNEGFSVDDFKKVIDIKVSQWSKDSKMSKYLRPETLFGTKFEGYLNEQPKNNNQYGASNVEWGW